MIFAQVVDDVSSWPDLFPTEKVQEKERQRLFRIIEELVLSENATNEEMFQAARDGTWQSWRRAWARDADHPREEGVFDRHRLPAFHERFAGGGAIPLEAVRLGLEAYASDPNPVAVLIRKAMNVAYQVVHSKTAGDLACGAFDLLRGRTPAAGRASSSDRRAAGSRVLE